MSYELPRHPLADLRGILGIIHGLLGKRSMMLATCNICELQYPAQQAMNEVLRSMVA